jgi:hypothetical protein
VFPIALILAAPGDLAAGFLGGVAEDMHPAVAAEVGLGIYDWLELRAEIGADGDSPRAGAGVAVAFDVLAWVPRAGAGFTIAPRLSPSLWVGLRRYVALRWAVEGRCALEPPGRGFLWFGVLRRF